MMTQDDFYDDILCVASFYEYVHVSFWEVNPSGIERKYVPSI